MNSSYDRYLFHIMACDKININKISKELIIMTEDIYDTAIQRGEAEIDKLLGMPGIQSALNKKLLNDDIETDEEDWIEGSRIFAEENADIFKARLR